MDPSVVGKEVSHPLILKIKVKTRVEFSILQIPVGSLKGTSSVATTSSAQGSLGPPPIIPPYPQGPSRRTCSKQKTVEEPVEREKERKARLHSFFCHPFFLSCLLPSYFISWFVFLSL